MSGASCGGCRFAEPTIGDDDEPYVQCRRYPAQVFVLDGQPTQAWPSVIESDWCGEYQQVNQGASSEA